MASIALEPGVAHVDIGHQRGVDAPRVVKKVTTVKRVIVVVEVGNNHAATVPILRAVERHRVLAADVGEYRVLVQHLAGLELHKSVTADLWEKSAACPSNEQKAASEGTLGQHGYGHLTYAKKMAKRLES